MNEVNIIRRKYGDASLENDAFRPNAEVYSIIGNRKLQQDFAGVVEKDRQLLAVICDGMGGMTGGERAGSEAVRDILQNYEEQNVTEINTFLKQSAIRADTVVHELKNPDGGILNAGTTEVAVFISEDRLHWISVGDSRIYLLRDGILTQLTRDHNYREELIDSYQKGQISRAQFEKESNDRIAEALTSYLGIGGVNLIGLSGESIRLKAEDQILLCSDGLYKSLSSDQMKAMLLDNQVNIKVSVKRLVQMALEQAVKRQDNTTVILIQCGKRVTGE